MRCSHFPVGSTGLVQGNSMTQARKLLSVFILRRADVGQPGTDTFIYRLEAMITLCRCQCTHASGHGVKAAADIMGIVISVIVVLLGGLTGVSCFFVW